MRTQARFLASLSGLRIQHCHEMWYRLKTGLGFGVAVAVVWASGYSSYSTRPLAWESTYALGAALKRQKKKKKKKLAYHSVNDLGVKIKAIPSTSEKL